MSVDNMISLAFTPEEQKTVDDFKSLADAPGGFSEKMKEIMWSLGAGFNFKNSFRLDAAYLVSTVQTNPLDQTLRLSLGFNLDGIKTLFK